MPEKEIKLAIKILGLLGSIFVLIAQFVPWGSLTYLFGFDMILSFDFFYINIFRLATWQSILFGIFMIVLFVINLILIIISFLRFQKFDMYGPQMYLKFGIIATVEMILYIIAVQASGIGSYGIGFILIIISFILFYIAYSIGRAFNMVPIPGAYQQPMYQQQPHTYNQPQQGPPPQYQVPPPPPQSGTGPQTSQDKSAKKFCPNCGSKLTPNAKFCSGCGQKV